jgi:hypothetical protein
LIVGDLSPVHTLLIDAKSARTEDGAMRSAAAMTAAGMIFSTLCIPAIPFIYIENRYTMNILWSIILPNDRLLDDRRKNYADFRTEPKR